MNHIEKVRKVLMCSQREFGQFLKTGRETVAYAELGLRKLPGNSELWFLKLELWLITKRESEKAGTYVPSAAQAEWLAEESRIYLHEIEDRLKSTKTQWHRLVLQSYDMKSNYEEALKNAESLTYVQENCTGIDDKQQNWLRVQLDIIRQKLRENGPLAQKELEMKIAALEAEMAIAAPIVGFDMEVMLETKKTLAAATGWTGV